MIIFACEACGLPMSMPECDAGNRARCPSCSEVTTIPERSDMSVKAVRIEGRQISASTFQIDCPRCGGTTNFRESSLGSSKKCRNCGFKMQLPRQIIASGKGCLVVAVFLVAMALVVLSRVA